MAGNEGKWYISFIPLTAYGIKIAIYEENDGMIHEFNRDNACIIYGDVVHACGYYDYIYNGYLRLQLYNAVDNDKHPLTCTITKTIN